MKETTKQALLDEARELLQGEPEIEDIEMAVMILRALVKIHWTEKDLRRTVKIK